MRYKKDDRGYYRANVPVGTKDSKGRPQYATIRAKTITELKAMIDQKKDEVKSGLVETAITLDEWYQSWITVYKKPHCRITTLNFYRTLYKKHIQPFLGNKKLRDIRELDCQVVMNAISKDGLSEKTAKNVRSILFSLLDTAKRNHYVTENVAQKLSVKGKPQNNRRALTLEEREKYLKACKELEFGMFGAFLYWFGLRRGECLALRKEDITENGILINKQITYTHNNQPSLENATKTDAGVRTVPIPELAREYIDFDALEPGFIFHDDDGNPLSYSEITRRWKKFITQALGKDTKITMHYLRHNYATMLCENDVPLLTIKTICGHEDIKTTMQIYQHYSELQAKQGNLKVVSLGKKTD